MIKVGFDISQTAFWGGVATYTKNLANELAKSKALEMVFMYSSLRSSYHGNLLNVKSYPLPPKLSQWLFNEFRKVPVEWFVGEMDVFHSSDWIQPSTRAKKVTTYHDVVPIKYPQWSNPEIIRVHKRRLKIVEAEIDMVIAVSEATKQDLLEVSKIPQDKIRVVYEGVADYFKPQPEAEIEKFKKKYNLPKEFVLAIGGVGERRNLERVKEAAKGYNLVITGQSLPLISDLDMPLLYAASKALLYPSLYEGFGLPILEAIASGTPVITSNVSSMPEIASNTAILCNPYKTEDITQALRSVMEDESLRKELKLKGFTRAKKFSWQKCAEETVEVYQSLEKT